MSIKAADVRKHLFSLTARGIKFDLKRIIEASNRIGVPHSAYKCIHVAGTNGKGSTCAYIESILRTSGFKTGLFTSPHILNFEERFQIDGKIISEDLWLGAYEKLSGIIDKLKLTFFEASTLIAFDLFKATGVEWAVFETGMGGRLDATNIISPVVSVISSVSMDHMEFLGDNLLSVFREKLGIVKKNTPLILAANPDEDVMRLARKVCSEAGADLTVVSSDGLDSQQTPAGTRFSYNGQIYDIQLHGSFQVLNSLMAINAVRKAGISDDAVIKEGLLKANLPGRFQKIEISGKNVIFDVGHNPEAAEAFITALQANFPNKKACIVTGIMKDKDTAGIIANYLKVAETIIFTQPGTERAESAQNLLSRVPPEKQLKCFVIPDVASAVKAALCGKEELVCIAGSFYTVSEGFSALGIKPF